MSDVRVQSGMNNPIRNGIVVRVAVRFPVIFSPLYKSIVPLDWIIVFHSTSFHLLISILHFIRCNEKFPHYLHFSSRVLIDIAFYSVEQYQGHCCAAEVFFDLSIGG